MTNGLHFAESGDRAPKSFVPGMVSIITPTFNRRVTLTETLQSIQQQSYDNWESIIVDDGSTDSTAEMVASFADADGRIRFQTRQRPPNGACACRNIGVEMARGEFVMFLDSDDVLAPHCLKQRVSAFASAPDNDYIVFPALLFRATPGDEEFLWNVLTDDDDQTRFLHLDSPWQGTGPLWTRDAFRAVGGWSENLACWQDIELSLRSFAMHMRYKVRYDLPPDLYLRRGDGSTISSAALWEPRKLASKRQVLEAAMSYFNSGANLSRSALKSFAVTVLADHVRGLGVAEGRSILRTAAKLGLFEKSERLLLNMLILLSAKSLSRIPGMGFLRSVALRYFATSSTIGRIRYSEPQEKTVAC